jgi:glycosyltransferase involved in cell wall biosynthesis
MKHVWILNHYAQAPDEAGGTRHYHLAEYLKSKGWKATIIAASVSHNSGSQRFGAYEAARYEEISNVPFLWVHTPEYTGNGRRRILNILAYTWNVLKKGTTLQLHRPDVIVGSSVHPLAVVAASFLAARFKVPFVFEVRDLWPQTLIDMGRLKERGVLTWLLRKMELWLYRKASSIVVLLPHADEYIVPLGIPKRQIVWIPNGVDLALFPLPVEPVCRISEEFTLMYFGALGHANGLQDVLLAMKLVQDKGSQQKITLRIIGDGSLKIHLMGLAKQFALGNVSFEMPVAKSQISTLAKEADAFVIAVLNLPELYRYGISMNKLFDYFAAARPIVIASDAANNPVAEANAGITVPSENPENLADAIIKMAEMSVQEREQMGRNGRLYVEQNHSFEKLSAKFAAVLDDVCR